MRHIFHEILARYLASEQHAFDASPRELWPEPKASWHPQARKAAGTSAPEVGRHLRAYGELEPQS